MGNGMSNDMEIFADGELEQEFTKRGGATDVGLKELVVQGYRDVIQSIIRPARCRYDTQQLGAATFAMQSAQTQASDDASDQWTVRRKDFSVRNDRELELRCSHWQLFASEEDDLPLVSPCLVYLHSNLGSRLDALRMRDLALTRGMSVLAFDCSGSGLSDGVYVTVGWNEAKDLHFVLQHLEGDETVNEICIYAHSMGTFPAIVNVACRSLLPDKKMRSNLDSLPSYFRSANVNLLAKPIKGLVLDGGYATMSQLTEELMSSIKEEGFAVPKSILKVACKVIQKSVKKRADVNLDLLRPIDFVPACSVPALFISGKDDRYVASHHSKDLTAKYAGPTVVKIVDGDHYTAREASVYSDAMDFLLSSLWSKSME